MLTCAIARRIVGGAARAVYAASSGADTPHTRHYSLAESLVARGASREAALEFERAAAQYPDDPNPCVRLERLSRDRLDARASAAEWLLRAHRVLRPGAGLDLMVSQELTDPCLGALASPRHTIPELDLSVSAYPETPSAHWARE